MSKVSNLLIRAGVVAWLSSGCTDRAGPDSALARITHTYAPELRLGERIAEAARQRYQFEVAPYVGYADTSYHGPDGFGRLYVELDQYAENRGQAVPRWARVKSLHLTADSAAAVVLAERRLRTVLGPPEEYCYAGHMSGQRMRALYWPGGGGRGVLLVAPTGAWVSRQQLTGGERPERAAALLAIGAESPINVVGVIESCPAAS